MNIRVKTFEKRSNVKNYLLFFISDFCHIFSCLSCFLFKFTKNFLQSNQRKTLFKRLSDNVFKIMCFIKNQILYLSFTENISTSVDILKENIVIYNDDIRFTRIPASSKYKLILFICIFCTKSIKIIRIYFM